MWDFSALLHATGTSATTVLHDTSSVFLTSNLMLILPDGSVEYMRESSSDSYINGIYDAASHATTSYNNCDISYRPVTYGTVDTATYSVDDPSTATTGKGSIMQTGDAYGTLKLPTGIFNDVLRIKKVQQEIDTSGAVPVTTTTVSYLWFDSVHNAPLFRLDSVIGVIGSRQTAMYLSIPSGLSVFNSGELNYAGYLGNNELLVTGPFDNGRGYEIELYNLIGKKVLSYEFTAVGNVQRFETGSNVSPGIYIVRVIPQNDPAAQEVIKVIKS